MRPPRAVPDDDGTLVQPGHYLDPLVRTSRMSGSTFIEIQEVRARDDGMVFLCTGVQGLLAVDARDPAKMRIVGRFAATLGSGRYPRCQHVAWDGDIIYMASRGDEIQPVPFVAAFDLKTGAQLAAYTAAGRTFEGIATAGGRLYLAMHGDGVAVLERAAASLVQRGTVAGLTNAWGIAVQGTTAYVADGPGGLAVVDVKDVAAPAILGRVSTGGAAQSVDIHGTTAYVAAGAGGLVTVDVADPTAPRVLGRVETGGSALQVTVSENRAYVANWNDVRVYDVTDPADLRMLATERIQSGSSFSRVLGVGVRGTTAFAGEWTGLYAYEFIPGRDAPDLGVSEPAIEFGRIKPGESDATTLVLRNDGTAPLVAWFIETTNPAFGVDRDGLVLRPGAPKTVEITYRPRSTSEDTGTLRITSDDPDQAVLKIPLRGNRKGVGVGDPAPEVEVDLVGGGRWKSSAHSGSVRVLAYFATF